MLWLILGLLSAFFYALYHIASKKYVKNADPQYMAFALLVLIAIFTTPLVFILRKYLVLTNGAFMGFIGVGLSIAVSNILYMKSLKEGDVSKSTPLLTLTPFFTLVIAMLWLKEMPSIVGIIGIVILIIGTYILNYRKEHTSYLGPFKTLISHKSSRLMLTVAVIYGFGSVIDKYTINHSNVMTRLILFVYFAIFFQLLYFFLRDGRKLISKTITELRNNYKGLLLIMVLHYLVIIPQMVGISMTYTAFIIALKRLAALFTVIFAYFIFKEKEGFCTTLVGAVLMVLGVMLMVM